MSDTFRTFVVPAAHVELARALCALDTGGAGMFTTALAQTQDLQTITHYISTGWVPPRLAAASPLAAWEQDDEGKWIQTSYIPGRTDAVYFASQQADPPVSCTEADIQHLFDESDITEQDPWTACSRLELKIYEAPQDAVEEGEVSEDHLSEHSQGDEGG